MDLKTTDLDTLNYMQVVRENHRGKLPMAGPEADLREALKDYWEEHDIAAGSLPRQTAMPRANGAAVPATQLSTTSAYTIPTPQDRAINGLNREGLNAEGTEQEVMVRWALYNHG